MSAGGPWYVSLYLGFCHGIGAFAVEKFGYCYLGWSVSMLPSGRKGGKTAGGLTWTFHCDLSSSGTASLTSWLVIWVYCCRASCWLGDSWARSKSPSPAMLKGNRTPASRSCNRIEKRSGMANCCEVRGKAGGRGSVCHGRAKSDLERETRRYGVEDGSALNFRIRCSWDLESLESTSGPDRPT